jgi:transposase
MKNFLTKTDRIDLILQHRQETVRKNADRIKSVLWKDEGWSYEAIAKALFLDSETTRRHVKDYLSAKKLTNSSGGSESKLSDNQTTDLINHLEENTYLTSDEICLHVLEKYNIHYTRSGMQKWLHNHKFSYKQPHGIPSKADHLKQLEFNTFYNDLKSCLRSDEVIMFGDGVHPSMATKLSHGWIRKGVNKDIATTGSRTRINILGAINLETMDVFSKDYNTLDADNTCDFLENLKKHMGNKKIHLFLDNGPSNKNKKVKLKAIKLGIQIHYLPTYSPNCNPIERLWKVMNKIVRNNVFFHSAKEFRCKIKEFFDTTWDNIKDKYTSWITDKFQVIKKSVF